MLAELYPLPTWDVDPAGATSSACSSAAGATSAPSSPRSACPTPPGSIQRLEEPGRPDIRQSNRGPGTGLRVAIPVLNIHKTRLNDPFMWFMGTNDQPGDYRSFGLRRLPRGLRQRPRAAALRARTRSTATTARTQTVDPTIPKDEPGHPLQHDFTRAIPTSQCMNCHMHQPNMFLNTYLGYTMWDYESDAPLMWPEKQKLPDRRTRCATILDRNPEGGRRRAACGATSSSCASV